MPLTKEQKINLIEMIVDGIKENKNNPLGREVPYKNINFDEVKKFAHELNCYTFAIMQEEKGEIRVEFTFVACMHAGKPKLDLKYTTSEALQYFLQRKDKYKHNIQNINFAKDFNLEVLKKEFSNSIFQVSNLLGKDYTQYNGELNKILTITDIGERFADANNQLPIVEKLGTLCEKLCKECGSMLSEAMTTYPAAIDLVLNLTCKIMDCIKRIHIVKLESELTEVTERINEILDSEATKMLADFKPFYTKNKQQNRPKLSEQRVNIILEEELEKFFISSPRCVR
jgi:hypothetical protein